LKPLSGNIEIFGEVLSRNKQQLWKIRQKIGFLFQNPDDQLFAPTIQEDIAFAARNLKLDEKEVKNRVDWALKSVNLSEFKSQSPFNLSWGQKKRAALAGLLVMKPRLLILDEPFANLDFISIHNHLKIIEELRKSEKMTILFTSHNLFFVEKWATKMLVIDKGQQIFEGIPAEGLKNSEVRKLLGSYEEIAKLIEQSK